MLILPLQLNKSVLRWTLAAVCSLGVNLLLLGVLVQHEPPAEQAPVYTASVIEAPRPPEAPRPLQAAAGVSSSAWQPVLPSSGSAPARPPVLDVPFNIEAPVQVDPAVLPVPGAFTPDLGAYTAAGSDGGGVSFDRGARMLNRSVFDRFYPNAARVRRISGVSVIEFDISETGKVTGARLVSSEPRGIFERAALKGAAYVRFQPAVKGGKPVGITQRVRLEWIPPGEK